MRLPPTLRRLPSRVRLAWRGLTAVGRSRRLDRESGYTTRTVFMVYVFGQENAGKVNS